MLVIASDGGWVHVLIKGSKMRVRAYQRLYPGFPPKVVIAFDAPPEFRIVREALLGGGEDQR